MTRKIVSIQTPGDDIFAVCDDGSLWAIYAGGTAWRRLADIPQDDGPVPPAPPVERWRPDGSPMWCVDTNDGTAVECPNEAVFVRWAKHQQIAPWVMVEASTADYAVRVSKKHAAGDTTIEALKINIDGVGYDYLFDTIPF